METSRANRGGTTCNSHHTPHPHHTPSPTLTDVVDFTDEDGQGKYLDLHQCYDYFINLKQLEVSDRVAKNLMYIEAVADLLSK